MIVGLAFMVAYLASGLRRWSFLIPAVPTLTGGIIGFSFTLPFIPWWWRGQLANFWPVLLVLAGILMLLGGRATSPADVLAPPHREVGPSSGGA